MPDGAYAQEHMVPSLAHDRTLWTGALRRLLPVAMRKVMNDESRGCSLWVHRSCRSVLDNASGCYCLQHSETFGRTVMKLLQAQKCVPTLACIPGLLTRCAGSAPSQQSDPEKHCRQPTRGPSSTFLDGALLSGLKVITLWTVQRLLHRAAGI
jgi:hypothetical protein